MVTGLFHSDEGIVFFETWNIVFHKKSYSINLSEHIFDLWTQAHTNYWQIQVLLISTYVNKNFSVPVAELALSNLKTSETERGVEKALCKLFATCEFSHSK